MIHTRKLPKDLKLILPELSEGQQLASDEMLWLLRNAMPVLKGAEYKVLMVVFCSTYDMGRKTCLLSLKDFVWGYNDERGWHNGTGLTKSTVLRAAQALVADGLVRRTQEAGCAYEYRIVPSEFVAACARRAGAKVPVRKRRRRPKPE